MVSIDVITEDSIHCTHGNGSQHARRLPEHPEKSGGTHLDEWGGSVRGPEEVIQLEIIGLGRECLELAERTSDVQAIASQRDPPNPGWVPYAIGP